MQPTGVVINRESWLLLMEEPLYSIRFIDREGTQELAVVSRVEDLDWFIDASLPLSLSLCTWQSPKGIWVVAVGYQLHPTFGGSKGGVFYLNPRQVSDTAIVRKLVRQEKLTVILLSEDTELHYTVSVPLSPPRLERWQAAVARLGPSTANALSDAEEDPAFNRALQAFQAQYSPEDVFEERLLD